MRINQEVGWFLVSCVRIPWNTGKTYSMNVSTGLRTSLTCQLGTSSSYSNILQYIIAFGIVLIVEDVINDFLSVCLRVQVRRIVFFPWELLPDNISSWHVTKHDLVWGHVTKPGLFCVTAHAHSRTSITGKQVLTFAGGQARRRRAAGLGLSGRPWRHVHRKQISFLPNSVRSALHPGYIPWRIKHVRKFQQQVNIMTKIA